MKTRQFGSKVPGGCPDCGVLPGTSHKGGCDIERCPECGRQRLNCGCITELPDLPWTGLYPDTDTAAAFGLWCKWDKGWITCKPTDTGALPDIQRLTTKYKWDKELRTCTQN